MMKTKVKYLNVNAEVVEIEAKGGLLEALEYIKANSITGAKVYSCSEWIDVDSFMVAGRKMFAPIGDE